MEAASNPYIGAMRALAEILVSPADSEDWIRRRDAAVREVETHSRPTVADDYRPEEIEANDERQMQRTAEGARTAAIQAAERIRSMNGDPRLEVALMEAAGHLVMPGTPVERLQRAEETINKKMPLIIDVEDSSLRKTLMRAYQFCKVRNLVIHSYGELGLLECAIERVRLRARRQNQPQVLAFEPVGGKFLITSQEIFERDRPFELGPEHVVFITT